jgi:formate dehydrogenase iron-sulfur subunit
VKNNLPVGEDKELSSNAYTVVKEFNGIYYRKMCMHCNEPTCASVCPVGAFTKMAEGPVVYDASKCIGCRYCMQACPFQVPRYEWEKTAPRVQKCTFCFDKVSGGGLPACAEACPTGATKFGDRDELVKEALERIKSSPGQYVNYVYGLEEVGGTSVLYISSVPFEQLGFKMYQKQPLPMLTWNALSKIPSVVITGGTVLYGIWWITNRRKEVQEYEKKINASGRNEEE